VKDGTREGEPAAVPEGAGRDGEAGGRRPRAEPVVWTERMLTALENAVKGGKWHSLIASVPDRCLLGRAWAVLLARSTLLGPSALEEMSQRPERRVRETGTHDSEVGGAG
jgi:hypothetical protein